jgi:hypothetical protein
MKGKPKTAEHTERAKAANARRIERKKKGLRNPGRPRTLNRPLTEREEQHRQTYENYRVYNKQWKADQLQARLMGEYALAQDVRLSKGLLYLRTLFDPSGRVSHGWFSGTIRWDKRWVPYDGVFIASNGKRKHN